jgi:predicted ATPase/DNA-binding SARP family transcriptional activator
MMSSSSCSARICSHRAGLIVVADRQKSGHYHRMTVLSISVLGPIEVSRDGAPLAVPSGKTTQLLIRLALDAGTLVSADRLIDDLWGDAVVAVGRNTLQAKVSALRRALGDATVVARRHGGYVLDVDPLVVDAIEVLRLTRSASLLQHGGEAMVVSDLGQRVLSMFRGEILPDAGDGDWVVPYRTRLTEVRCALIESSLAARLESGEVSGVIGELEAQLSLDPLREGLWVLLITGLYRDGRQSEALAAYRRVRGLLLDELGLDPGPALQAVERAVLAGDASLDRQTPDQLESSSSSATARGNLPALAASLVGRGQEVEELSGLLREHRLVSIVGPGGVGKTRLALEVARGDGSADGAWLVRLENVRTPDSLAQAIGESLAMSGPTEAMVIDRLRATQALLVLDNCEHLVDAVADLVERLLTAAAGVRVLVTSQVPLGVDGEVSYQLEPLPLTKSVELFALRASQLRRSFVVNPDIAEAIEGICRSLDGLPLAIELAAARTRALSVPEIARRLDDRFGLLSDPSGRRPERHRALGAAIAWSYDLLFPDDQRGLWALSCFTGGAPLAAAEDVAIALGVPSESAIDTIGRLTDRSLVAVEDGPGGEFRYRLLDSVRAYAAARLDEAGATDVARAAHLAWLAAASRESVAEQRGPRLAQHVAFFVRERANIDAALAWAAVHDPLEGLRVANNFGWISVILGEGAVAAQRLRRVVEAAGDLATPSDLARALSLIGWDEAAADVDRARADAEQSVILADLAAEPDVVAASRFSLAFVLLQQGLPRQAMEVADEWIAIRGSSPAGDTWNVACCWVLVGYAALGVGDVARLATASAEAALLEPGLDDGWMASQLAANSGRLALAEQRFDDAASQFAIAADHAHLVGLPATEGFHLVNVGLAQHQTGDDRAAIATYERAIELTTSAGLMRMVAVARVRVGQLLRRAGDRDASRSCFELADAWFRASGGGAEADLAQCMLAAMDAEDGLRGAEQRLTLLLDTAADKGDVEVEVLVRDALAAVRAESGDDEEAISLLQLSDALMASSGARLREADRLDAHRARSVLSPGGASPKP